MEHRVGLHELLRERKRGGEFRDTTRAETDERRPRMAAMHSDVKTNSWRRLLFTPHVCMQLPSLVAMT